MYLTQPPTAAEMDLSYNSSCCKAGCEYGNGYYPRITHPGNTRLGDFIDEFRKEVDKLNEGEMDEWDWAHAGLQFRNVAIPNDKEWEEVKQNTVDLKREYAEKMEAVRRAEEETQRKRRELRRQLSLP